MGVYIDRSKIAFSKKTYKCPCCGEMKYNKFEYDGVEMDNDKYGHCWNPNGNCFPYKSRICGTMAYPRDEEIRAYYFGESGERIIPQVSQTVSKSVFYYNPDDRKYFSNDNVMMNPLFRYLTGIGLNVAESIKKYCVTSFAETNPNYSCFQMDKVLFWLRDINGRYCDGKEMCYDETGHRMKFKSVESGKTEGTITWTSKRTAYREATRQRYSTNKGDEIKNYMREFESKFMFRKPLFGEHLLAYQQGEPILLFESEKTAVVMDAYCRMAGKQVICVALGGKTMFNDEKMKWLKGRNVTYMPDSDTLKVIENEDGNPEREIDMMYRKLKEKNPDLADSIKLGDCCWKPSTLKDSILRVKKYEVDAILQEKGVETIEDAKLDFADIVCWRFEHRKSPIEELPFGDNVIEVRKQEPEKKQEKAEYISPLATNKDFNEKIIYDNYI